MRFTVMQLIRQSIWVIYAVTLLSIITGTQFDAGFKEVGNKYPVIIILIPAFINVAGDLGDVFGSRLTTLLYTGKLTVNLKPLRLFIVNLLAILAVSSTGFFVATFIAEGFAYVIFNIYTPILELLPAVLFSGIIATAIIALLSAIITLFTYKNGWDPDSVVPPLTTTAGDIIATSLFIYFSKLFIL